MSHHPKCCPINVHLKHGKKRILTHDKARAQTFLRGLHPHGPVAVFEARAISAAQQPVDDSKVPVVKPVHVAQASSTTKGPTEHSIKVADAGLTYTMAVGVGKPPTLYNLMIDTGSSNTWIGAGKKYVPTQTSVNTQKQVSINYASGSFSGTEYEDQLTLGKFVINKQSIGVASSTNGFREIDGILGIGPVDLTQGTITGTPSVPTVIDNLYAQNLIQTEAIGIYYAPTTRKGELNGEFTFGQADDSRHVGDIHYVPITKKYPANRYWGVDQTISYGKDKVILQSAGIIDTGTTLLLLATDAFQAYQTTTGAVVDEFTGHLTINEEQYSQLKSLFFHIGEVTYELTPNAQIWPRALNSILGGDDEKIYLVAADLGRPSGSGLDFMCGFAFLQRFYTVYDTTNSRVGFANTRFTNAVSN